MKEEDSVPRKRRYNELAREVAAWLGRPTEGRPTQAELAAALGVTRQCVNGTVKRLVAAGVRSANDVVTGTGLRFAACRDDVCAALRAGETVSGVGRRFGVANLGNLVARSRSGEVDLPDLVDAAAAAAATSATASNTEETA